MHWNNVSTSIFAAKMKTCRRNWPRFARYSCDKGMNLLPCPGSFALALLSGVFCCLRVVLTANLKLALHTRALPSRLYGHQVFANSRMKQRITITLLIRGRKETHRELIPYTLNYIYFDSFQQHLSVFSLYTAIFKLQTGPLVINKHGILFDGVQVAWEIHTKSRNSCNPRYF